MKSLLKEHKSFVILFVTVFITHSILAIVPPLNGDEAMFWEWSRHLAFGYYAHPPLTAWIVAFFVKVFTLTKYTVRLGSIALHLGTILFVYLLALDISAKKKHAFAATLLFVVMPLSVLMGTAMTTDSSLIFCFTAAVYFVRKAIVDERKKFWYIAGVACGGMLLSKFFAVLFFPGVFVFMLADKQYRKLLVTKEPYLATLLALIVFSPFLYWNSQNNWLTFQFNLVVRHGDSKFDLYNVAYYLVGQLAAASPAIFITLAIGLVVYSLRRKGNVTDKRMLDSLKLISYIVLFTLLFFLAFSFKVKIGSHWPGIIYPIGAVALASWIFQNQDESISSTIRRRKIYVLNLVVGLLIICGVGFVALFPKTMPDRYLYTDKVYDEGPVMMHFFGWKEVGERIDELQEELAPAKGKLFLTSGDYALAAMLGFYTPSHPQFYLIGAGKETVHGKSYLLWAKDVKQKGDDCLFVSDYPRTYVNRVPQYFEKTEQLEPLVVRDETGRIVRVFYFTHGIGYLANEPDSFSIW